MIRAVPRGVRFFGVDVPEITTRGPEPAYQQIARWLRERIAAGDWRPMLDPLPSETDLTGMFGVGRDTARAAIRVLRDEGLITTIPQRGSYVTDPPTRARPGRDSA